MPSKVLTSSCRVDSQGLTDMQHQWCSLLPHLECTRWCYGPESPDDSSGTYATLTKHNKIVKSTHKLSTQHNYLFLGYKQVGLKLNGSIAVLSCMERILCMLMWYVTHLQLSVSVKTKDARDLSTEESTNNNIIIQSWMFFDVVLFLLLCWILHSNEYYNN